MDKFEQRIRELTKAINGQHPRPWMTDLKDPSCAEVFIVGYNQATAYHSDFVDYERFMDSLFNRNGERCRQFYEDYRKSHNDTTKKKKSRTRTNIEMFTDKLNDVGVYSILETNVVCYGAPKKKHLRLPEHNGGKARGMEIFRSLVNEIGPRALILHGKDVCKEFRRAFNLASLPDPPETKDEFVQKELDSGTQLFVIRSLGQPEFNKWKKWSDDYLGEVAKRVRQSVAAGS